jgi:hypothetical protein
MLCFKTRHYENPGKSADWKWMGHTSFSAALILMYRAKMPIKSGISGKALWKKGNEFHPPCWQRQTKQSKGRTLPKPWRHKPRKENFCLADWVLACTRPFNTAYGSSLLYANLVLIYIYIYGGKQRQPTPKNLPRMQCARAIPVAWLGSGSC